MNEVRGAHAAEGSSGGYVRKDRTKGVTDAASKGVQPGQLRLESRRNPHYRTDNLSSDTRPINVAFDSQDPRQFYLTYSERCAKQRPTDFIIPSGRTPSAVTRGTTVRVWLVGPIPPPPFIPT